MSTFNGIVHMFPDILIDYFRPHPGRRPPLACFLSHVHSDHLVGLEALKSPFVFCSTATREILLKLEKRPSRIAYANGLCEASLRTYTHLRSLLKPIPLETPTTLELEPGNHIQVTLFDANHCPGAVMFLIEGNGKAILYTGDIRSEPWWVNSIARNPSLVEYSHGLKTLDCIYLDTSMLSETELQPKSEGLRELLSMVAQYPKDTVFHLQAWTYGYEEVWIALSKALKSKIHVDKYKLGVYKSLVAKPLSEKFAVQVHHTKEAPYLVGFHCGNDRHEGCLTLDANVRIHSCEKGTLCPVMASKHVVWIQPIVAHIPGSQDMVEIGVGGGGDDFVQGMDLETLTANVEPLLQMISERRDLPTDVKDQIKAVLLDLTTDSLHPKVRSSIEEFSENDQIRLESVVWPILQSIIAQKQQAACPLRLSTVERALPTRIVFPYARHSSLPELRHLVKTFRPKDVWPCTVNIPRWEEHGITMRALFGSCCSGDIFEHDIMIEKVLQERRETGMSVEEVDGVSYCTRDNIHKEYNTVNIVTNRFGEADAIMEKVSSLKREHEQFVEEEKQADDGDIEATVPNDSQAFVRTIISQQIPLDVLVSTKDVIENGEWGTIGLISTTNNHSEVEIELGEQ